MKNIFFIMVFLSILIPSQSLCETQRTLIDAAGRTVSVPSSVNHVICSGPGCLRLLTYLGAQDTIVAVDDIENRHTIFDARPYAMANPQFREYPLFGEFRGHDNPELIMTLNPLPQVIFKTFATMGYNPEELQNKTGIPVIVLEYGNLTDGRELLFSALRLMGRVMGKQERTSEVIGFISRAITDLNHRTANVPDSERKTCYIGGIAYKGPHGYQSTEPCYPPFVLANCINAAGEKDPTGKIPAYSDVAKEKIVAWDPEFLFLDLSSLQMGDATGGLHELKTDPAYQTLTAVQKNAVYGVFPYNWYTQNIGSILADAYFICKIVYPDRFADIDPVNKADDIYSFLVGKSVFDQLNKAFNCLAFSKIPVR